MNRKRKKTIRKPTKRMKRDNRTTSFFFTNRTKAHGSLMENQEELMELLLSITLCIAHGTQKARVLSLPSFIFLSCKSAPVVLFKDFLTVTVFLRFYDSDDT